jgi:protein-S-isoprenylcysteine O-methyltransferase Ste14
MLQLITFAAVSVGIVRFSWKPLHDPHSHGFCRFFAFESILALILLNAEHWLRDPFSPLQIVSWFMLMVSLFMVTYGLYLLRAIGRPSGNIENTSALVTVGAYRFIRHPLYSSLLWLAWGAFFKDPSVAGAALVLIATATLIATAHVEEAENLAKFGVKYAAYVKTTRMFVPFVF